MQAKRLSYYPFDAISLHGPSDLPVYTDPNSTVSQHVWVKNQGKSFAMQSPALFVNLFKLRPFTQQMLLLESEHLVTIRQKAVCVPWPGGRLK